MALTPEAKVKVEVKRCLDKYPNLWYFFPVATRYSVAGIPDIVGNYNGKFFAIEVKAEKGNPTALQLRTIDKIRSTGGHAGIVKPSVLVGIAEQVRTILGE